MIPPPPLVLLVRSHLLFFMSGVAAALVAPCRGGLLLRTATIGASGTGAPAGALRRRGGASFVACCSWSAAARRLSSQSPGAPPPLVLRRISSDSSTCISESAYPAGVGGKRADEKNSTSFVAAEATDDDDASSFVPPWNHPRVDDSIKKKRSRRKNKSRFRQHVNPLARQYQQPAELPDGWPVGTYDDCAAPLHLDIGCSKGGYLLEAATAAMMSEQQQQQRRREGEEHYNYLGLEIRPLVAQYAKERIEKWGLKGRLDFIGCNANVDLERILRRYQEAGREGGGTAASSVGVSCNDNDDGDAERIESRKLRRVTIQFPDPHFKTHHAKRRVVTPELVEILAKLIAPDVGQVFLQSDVQSVLDEMRSQFRRYGRYFRDEVERDGEYLPDNVWGVPTEREISVLEKGLPVYRTLFTRTSQPYESQAGADHPDGTHGSKV